MTQLLNILQNVSVMAFVALGIATAIGWVKRREASVGYLALAIVLLSFVSLFGRISATVKLPSMLAADITVVAFVGSAYALFRHRASMIRTPRKWDVAVTVITVAVTVAFVGSQTLVSLGAVSPPVEAVAALALIAVWAALVTEPAIRFWLIARSVPAVQAWRLRSLSLGFAGIVAVLVFAVAAGTVASHPAAQIGIQLVAIAIAPLLYVSFAPPAWLRREWRATEEEGLRSFMEQLLITDDRDALAARALDWAMRLVGGAAAATFDSNGVVRTSVGMNRDELSDVRRRLPDLHEGVNRVLLAESERRVLSLPIAGLASRGSLIVVSGPFTPGIGSDEVNRIQQFMSAFVTALDRRHLIEQLKESNKHLQTANTHKSVFLASMSHELRTPLNAILGFSELLMDSNGQFAPATRKRFLQQIHSSGQHLLGLINDILDLAKVEAGQMELRLQVMSVVEVVGQVLSTIEPLAAQKKIQLRTGEMSAGEITADPGKVKQMVLNLVANAVKFTPDSGEVTVCAVRRGDCIEVSVADNGIGIAPEDHARVFEGFQQVDSGIGRQQTGTGLGLTLTRRFASLHGGDVKIESALGKGSVFTIILPVEPRQPARRSAPPMTDKPKGTYDSRPLVLIVEDDAAAAELLVRQIERAGFQTEVARTGLLALARARARRPAAITLDILLPDLDGWEVLTRLKRDEATSDIPVMIVSVVDNPELGVALGALDYFVKPVAADELLSRLAKFNFQGSSSKTMTVLVVDDEPANREWLRRVLEPAGFVVVLASGGRQAIQMARDTSPDLVMLDLMMPEVTGFDVVEALRAGSSTRTIPILVLTAKTLTESDIKHLNGQVSTILRRGSTGASDLLELLQQAVVAQVAAN